VIGTVPLVTDLFVSYIIDYDQQYNPGSDRKVVGFTTTYVISAYHTTDVVSSNFDQGEVYNIMW
jgi:hypothetical protein